MSSYNIFAQFYDRLTENADYQVRSSYISNFFSQYGRGKGTVLDLACGTGSVAKQLSDAGYNVIGIDLSEDMLTVASGKRIENAVFIKADMTDFLLPEKVDYCVCSLDSLNHLDSLSEWRNCFECVFDSLTKGGLFVFDVNTIYKHNEILADNAFLFDEEDFFLAWDNELLKKNKVRILLDFFVYNGVNYDRFSEEFIETAYSIEEIISAFSDLFDIIGIYNELSLEPPREDSERLYFVLRKK